MKIDILCNNEPYASFTGVTYKDIWGEGKKGVGIGGAELALLTMCEVWHDAGHEVILYNNPLEANASPFEQRATLAFNPNENRDVVIVFRSPTAQAVPAKGLKVWWSCDQYTVGDFKHFSGFIDKIVCISPFHADYFKREYQIENTIVIDLPVRLDDLKIGQPKTFRRCIFTSVPDRGLDQLLIIWNNIKMIVPDASLVITSDYRLWGVGAGNEVHRIRWMSKEDVTFLGAVPRRQYLDELLKAEVIPYPCIYDELFCISVAEAQACGVFPVISNQGALPTTNMGIIMDRKDVDYTRKFIDTVVSILTDPTLSERRSDIQLAAWKRFDPQRILKEWDEKVFK